MEKFLLKFFIFLLLTIFIIIYLSYFGLETDKFNDLIKNKANEVNRTCKIRFQKQKYILIQEN